MHTEYYRHRSHNLGHDMEFKIYGHKGKIILAFPCIRGRFFDFEDRGMISALNWFIDEGLIRIYSVDSIDDQSWDNPWMHPADRMIRHNDYDNYITTELVPFVWEHSNSREGIMTTGTSMGATHAVNFFFRHPDIFNGVIALSGVYNARFFIGDYMDENVYINSPIDYLNTMTDKWYLEKYRKSQIILSVGQGAWEDPMLEDTLTIKHILEEKKIPAWIDIWGHDVNHDWPWWHKQMPYFLSKILLKK